MAALEFMAISVQYFIEHGSANTLRNTLIFAMRTHNRSCSMKLWAYCMRQSDEFSDSDHKSLLHMRQGVMRKLNTGGVSF